MSFSTYAAIAEDSQIRRRVVACVAQEGEGRNAPRWANEHAWELPGSDWVAAWESALVANADDDGYEPGADPGVITDQMILSAVQAARTS